MSEKTVDIPEEVEARAEKSMVFIKGPKGELSRDFRHPRVEVSVSPGKVTFKSSDDKKKTLALLGTFASHVRNMSKGVTMGWEAALKVVYSHFPMKVGVAGDEVEIQNFMGERKSRKTRIVGQTRVEVKKDEIIVTGIDKEDVGQTAANIELLTRVSGFDKRVFQDGCYITRKCAVAESQKG